MTEGKGRGQRSRSPGRGQGRAGTAGHGGAGPTWSPWCTTRSRRRRRPGTPRTSSTGCRQPPSPEPSARQQHSCSQTWHSPTEPPRPAGHRTAAPRLRHPGARAPSTPRAIPARAWKPELCLGHRAWGRAQEATCCPLGAPRACPSQGHEPQDRNDALGLGKPQGLQPAELSWAGLSCSFSAGAMAGAM